MKSLYKISIFLLFAILTSSCLHNNGDIGNLFGKWKLISIETDDETLVFDDIYVNFQNQVFSIQEIYSDNHMVTDIYSSYQNINDTIYVWDFYFKGTNNHLPEKIMMKEKDSFYIRENSNKSLILKNENHIWNFRKW